MRKIVLATTLSVCFVTLGCTPGFDLRDLSKSASENTPDSDSSTEPIPQPTRPPSPPTEFELPRIAWETKSNARTWSTHAFKVILQNGPSLLEGADDVVDYCPRFYKLSQLQRAWFWTSFISAMSYYESGWEPTARMHESTMGTDPVTGKPVYSEGLLQLSYQDRLGHPYCNEFDWSLDRRLSGNDPRKTILNPEKNLSCGIQILNRQIKRHRRIGIGSGAYWSVIKVTKPSNKIEKIKARVKEVRLCFKES